MVIQTLSDTYAMVPTIYFYCYFGDTERQRTLSVTRSLLKQLSARCGRLDERIISTFENDASLTEELCEGFLAAAFGRFRKVFVVVDALDECSEKERKSTIKMFNRHIRLAGCSVKVFLTSRPERDLEQLLNGNFNYFVDADDTSKDITPFVSATVDQCISDGLLVVSPDLKKYLIGTLNAKANGM